MHVKLKLKPTFNFNLQSGFVNDGPIIHNTVLMINPNSPKSNQIQQQATLSVSACLFNL